MSVIFYKDETTGESITYSNLLEDIRFVKTYNKHCKSKSYYEVFRAIVVSLVLGKKIILLDDDFSTEEIASLKFSQPIEFAEHLSDYDCEILSQIKTVDDLFLNILKSSNNWGITLFTSGTTGVPKQLSHSFSSITRSVKQSDRHSKSIWGFAYNPTHMAGIQVFFQALLNRNTIIRLFKLNREMILKQIQENRITHISATPTFYRLLLPANVICSSVKSLTSGGERFDSKTLAMLNSMFPNAKITNVYASTEAGAVFASTSDCFEIKQQYQPVVKVENDELFLHKSIIGASDALQIKDDIWYATGDIVEVISNAPLTIRFINRKNETINVGGYKVNPGEVEETMLTINGIEDVRVYSKSNSLLGNIICAEVVLSIDTLSEAEIRSLLQTKLQEFKIPRVIKFVDSLKVTRTGKIQRI